MRFLRPRGVAGRRRGDSGLVVAAAVVASVSFAGTAVASGLVTGHRIKDGSLRSVDLRTNRGVTGADVRDGTLSASKLSSLPQGPAGVKGPRGPRGVDGLDNFDYEVSAPVTVAGSSDFDITVPCPTGTVVGGGASSVGVIRMVESRPLADGSGWNVVVFNESATDVDAFGWAVCVGAP
jgi:hypothetical protein